MDAVEEIWYLSEKGHELMSNGDFSAAKTYFINAASVALNQSDISTNSKKQDFKNISESLLTLAKNAHVLNFKNYEKNYLGIDPSNKEMLKFSKLLQRKDLSLQEELEKLRGKKGRSNQINIPLGKYMDNKKLFSWVPSRLMNGIFTITGGSGSGKTECLKSLCSELIAQNIPVVILDLHGDIDVDIPKISLDYRGNHSVNPLELTSKSEIDGGPTPHINRIMTQFSYAIRDRFSSTQKSWVRNLLHFAYYQHGIVQDDPSGWNNTPPDFRYLLNLIKFPDQQLLESDNPEFTRLVETITNSTKAAVENRLAPILEHPAFSGTNKIPIENVVEEPMRILLKPLNTIDMQFLAADTIMRQIFAFLKSLGHVSGKRGRGKFRMFIMIDEVKILTGYKGKLNDPYHILNRFATEARKFGLGLILASQILGHFGRDIRSNSATKLVLRTMDVDEAKKCSKELAIDMKKLTNLNKPGEGFIKTSKNSKTRHIQLFPSSKHPLLIQKSDQKN